MNSYERILAVLNEEPCERLAYMPITMMFAADRIGVPYGKYVTDYRVLLEAQLATAETYGFDYVSAISDPAREATDLGADVRFFDDAPPAINEANALLREKERLGSIPKLDPLKTGSRTFDRVCGVRALAENVKHRLFIEGWVEGPCAEAADLRGINSLMLDFLDDPEFVRELFEYCTNNAIRFAEEQLKAGADIIGIGDAAASLIGPKLYKDFVFPYEKVLIDAIHQMNGLVRLHICGNITKSLPVIGMLGCDILDLDSMVPLDKVRSETGPNQVVSGNLDPVKVLRNGNPEMIEKMLEDCLEKSGGNYILAAGCEIPRDTPSVNLESMRNFAINHRSFPHTR